MSLDAVNALSLSITYSHPPHSHLSAVFHTHTLYTPTDFPSRPCLKLPTHLRGDRLLAMEVSPRLKLLGKSDKVRRFLQSPPVVEPVKVTEELGGVQQRLTPTGSVQGVTRLSMT